MLQNALNYMESAASQDLREMHLYCILQSISLAHTVGRINQDFANNVIAAIRYLSNLPRNSDHPPPAQVSNSETRSMSSISSHTGVAGTLGSEDDDTTEGAESSSSGAAQAPGAEETDSETS